MAGLSKRSEAQVRNKVAPEKPSPTFHTSFDKCESPMPSRANNEAKPELSIEFQALATAYMRLAEMADRNTLLDPDDPIDQD